MLVFELGRPRGDFYYDPRLAKRAIEEGRNSFCAQCHGPGGALDPNNEWNQKAVRENLERFNSQFERADADAIITYLSQQPQQ